MLRTMRRVLVLFLAVFISIGVLWSAGEACATTVTVWPDQLKIENYDTGGGAQPVTYQNPDLLKGSGRYYCVLNIPVGKVIRYVRVNYNAEPEYGFDVFLLRKTPSTPAEKIISFSAYFLPASTPGPGSMQSDLTDVSGPLTIKSGYRYFIEFNSGIEGSINSIQVVY